MQAGFICGWVVFCPHNPCRVSTECPHNVDRVFRLSTECPHQEHPQNINWQDYSQLEKVLQALIHAKVVGQQNLRIWVAGEPTRIVSFSTFKATAFGFLQGAQLGKKRTQL